MGFYVKYVPKVRDGFLLKSQSLESTDFLEAEKY